MPLSEFFSWAAYVQLYGPVDYQRRYDRPAALGAWMTQKSVGGEMKIESFIPYQKKVNTSGLSPVDVQVLKAFGKI